tara:strand:+ start:198 stop:803 length:606 start_codon:yes stop_codon:yes gene_type:complete
MAQYKIYGTNQPYTGKVVTLGNRLYTTIGGTLEGNSHEVVLASEGGNQNTEETLPTMNALNQPTVGSSNATGDVITTFKVGDASTFGRGTYYYASGTRVPNGRNLHHHTIIPSGRSSNFMTQHAMDGNEQDVFTTRRNVSPRQRVTRTNVVASSPTPPGGQTPQTIEAEAGGSITIGNVTMPDANTGGTTGGGRTGGGGGY